MTQFFYKLLKVTISGGRFLLSPMRTIYPHSMPSSSRRLPQILVGLLGGIGNFSPDVAGQTASVFLDSRDHLADCDHLRTDFDSDSYLRVVVETFYRPDD